MQWAIAWCQEDWTFCEGGSRILDYLGNPCALSRCVTVCFPWIRNNLHANNLLGELQPSQNCSDKSGVDYPAHLPLPPVTPFAHCKEECAQYRGEYPSVRNFLLLVHLDARSGAPHHCPFGCIKTHLNVPVGRMGDVW